MNYEKKYKEALERARALNDGKDVDVKGGTTICEYIFPELKDSEDERIRKQLLDWFKDCHWDWIDEDETLHRDDIIAWLEKQDEKKIYKVKPKFNVGDWVVTPKGIHKIIKIEPMPYNTHQYWTDAGTWFGDATDAHLWTIQDAKDGDVLYFNDNTIVVFKDLYNSTTFHSYCHIEDDIFDISKDEMPDWWESEGFTPATKEQCDLFFEKMNEAGYEWDAENKKVKKIKPLYIGKGLLTQVNEVHEYPTTTKEDIRKALMSISTEEYETLWKETFGESYKEFIDKLLEI